METRCSHCNVRQASLFRNISLDLLNRAQLYRHSQITFPARSTVFQEEESNDYIYTLYSGWAIVYKTPAHSEKRQILRFLLPGDLTGYQTESSALMPHSVATVTDAVFCVFPRDNIKTMLLNNPDISTRFIEMWSRDMSLCQNHLLTIGSKSAVESITFLLLEIFHRAKNQITQCYDPATNSIDFPLTQQDIGDATGITKIHVNRVMKSLTNSGFIQYHKKKLYILNEKMLCDISGFDPQRIKDQCS